MSWAGKGFFTSSRERNEKWETECMHNAYPLGGLRKRIQKFTTFSGGSRLLFIDTHFCVRNLHPCIIVSGRPNLFFLRSPLVRFAHGQVRPIGTLALFIVFFFKNTMLFTRTQTDPVNRRYWSSKSDPVKSAGLSTWNETDFNQRYLWRHC